MFKMQRSTQSCHILIIFHFSSSILHGCSSKIKLFMNKNKIFKFVNLKFLQYFCQTCIFLTVFKTFTRNISCLMLLGSSLSILFASYMNVDLFMFLPSAMIPGELFLNVLVGFF